MPPAVPTSLRTRGPSTGKRWRERLRHTQFPAVQLRADTRCPTARDRSHVDIPSPPPRGPAPRAPPAPAGEPYPRGRPRRLGGGGGRQVLLGNRPPPAPHVLRKKELRRQAGEASPASLVRSLSLQLQSRIPDARVRATFLTPDTVPLAFPGIAAGSLPLLACHPQTTSVFSALPNSRSIRTQVLPPFPVASTCHRPAHAALLPAAGRRPPSHLLRGVH